MNDVLKQLNQKTSLTRTLFFIIGDIVLIAFAVLFAFLLRFDGNIPSGYFDGTIQWVFLSTLFVIIPVFYFLKLYRLSWIYVSTKEVFALLKAVTISFGILGISIFILRAIDVVPGFPRSVFLILFILVFIFTGGFRLAKRMYLQIVSGRSINKGIRIIIVGAGDAGEQLVRSIIDGKTEYNPVCFVDDSTVKQGQVIHGVRVAGSIADIPKIVAANDIKEMVIALPSAGSKLIKTAVELGRQAGLKNIKVLPTLSEILDGEISMGIVREVEVKDLLQRDTVSLDTESIARFIAGKTVLITGAAGSIGSEIVRQTAVFNPSQLLLLDQDETGIFHISEEIKRKYPALSLE
ncbi:MAG TPA: polysaccharide biosynthesis protein, partial [candidate division CPR3 bacterium]|nr:polysaccharide biosynthesis protein [candidate division CPR3 bacterium]